MGGMNMPKILCLIETDDRNYYFRSALKRLQEEYPGEIEGECFSPMAARMDKSILKEIIDEAEKESAVRIV